MGIADLIAFAVVLVMATGWLLFRKVTDRSVRAACLVLGTFQIFAAACKMALSGIYGDSAGWIVLILGLSMVLFRKRWTLAVMAWVFVVVGVVNIVFAFSEPHYSFVLWGVVQFVIAGMLLRFVRQHRGPRVPTASSPLPDLGSAVSK